MTAVAFALLALVAPAAARATPQLRPLPRLDAGSGAPPGRARPALPGATRRAIVSDFGTDSAFVSWFPSGSATDAPGADAPGGTALLLASAGDGSPAAVQRDLATPLDLHDAALHLWVQVDHPERLSQLWVQLTGDGWTDFLTYHLERRLRAGDEGVWLELACTGDDAVRTGGPVLAAVDRIRVRIDDKGGGPVRVRLGRLVAVRRADAGVVSITFDDGWGSQFTAARTLLDARGMRATAFVIPYLIGTPRYMTGPMLRDLYDEGWDIGGHYHPSLEGRVDPELGHIVTSVHDFLAAGGFRRSEALFAYPQGYYDETVVIPALRGTFRAARTIEPGLDALPPADPMRLRAMEVLPGTRDDEIREWLGRAERDHLWLILVYHKIVTHPTYPTEVSPAAFARQLDLIAASGLAVRPVSQVLAAHGALPAGAGPGR